MSASKASPRIGDNLRAIAIALMMTVTLLVRSIALSQNSDFSFNLLITIPSPGGFYLAMV
ncbi:MAG: hypothetical protein ACHBN1_24690 [Heteroscytonema crispum UTEX LB 1556]